MAGDVQRMEFVGGPHDGTMTEVTLGRAGESARI
jgi:hypothetical protein